MRRAGKLAGWILAWPLLALACLWAAAALAIDLPLVFLRLPAALLFAGTLLILLFALRGQVRKFLACLAAFVCILAWWLSLAPSNDRNWQPDVARLAAAEINGDRLTVHNLRNADYRTETDYTPHWETRDYDLRELQGIDLFITYWGSPWIAHPIVSFRFGDDDYLAISVETRKEVGEEYSALLGFFRQYELIYVVADERDLIRLRTNYRVGEEVYLYRTTTSPEAARAILLGYMETINAFNRAPVWYNAITSNCTTGIRLHTLPVAGKAAAPWDWRLLLNGKGDEYAYQYGRLAGALPFDALKRQAVINDVARLADRSANFSWLIRQNRAGFSTN